MSHELVHLKKNGKIIFNNNVAVCQMCKGHHNVKNGKMERKLSLMNLLNQVCKVKI